MWPFNRGKKDEQEKRNAAVPLRPSRISSDSGGNTFSYFPIYTPTHHDSGSSSPGCDSGGSGGGDSGGGSCDGGN